ncbi:tyrosine-type recombinase/integrase [Thioalbus denitrificans]|uniref:Integrase n=1 Tax=Thioalbus denitrificans TaxID=547122 RepID=A0A369CCF1_9GAMM|nr:site-specific integrase [Thioalbus denitrificans]RCX31712.1 integrase [Thioalbus denitrificans]
MRFTDAKIAALKPQGRRYELFEGGGFGVRISTRGVKTFVLFYRHQGRLRRLSLGEYAPPTFTLADARLKAAEAKRALKEGKDPATEALERREAIRRAPTVDHLAEEYIERWAKPRKSSWREDQRMLEKDVLPTIGNLKAAEVRRRDIIMVLDLVTDRGALVVANRTAALLSRLFNFAVDRGIVDASPCVRLPTHAEHHRDRVLSDDEIITFWTGLDRADMTARTRLALKLILVTGQRPGEVCGMEEKELQGDTWIIPATRIKTRHKILSDHRVPLSDLAMEIIEAARAIAFGSAFLFPSPSLSGPMDEKSLSRAIRRNLPGGERTRTFEEGGAEREPALNMAHFTPHDLRRTCRTKLAELGVSDIVAERILNHALQGMARVYNHHTYEAEKVAALVAWANRLNKLTRRSVGLNVVALCK